MDHDLDKNDLKNGVLQELYTIPDIGTPLLPGNTTIQSHFKLRSFGG